MKSVRSRHVVLSASLAAAIIAGPTRAWADGADDGRRAESLYEEAIALIKNESYVEACPKLEESQRLDAGLGTEFHLADCYEHIGKLGTAFALFRDVAKAARAADKQKLGRLAEDRQKALAPRVPRLLVTFSKAEPTADVVIDKSRASSSEWATEGLPVDPGQHEVEVRVVGKEPWRALPNVHEGEVVKLSVDLVAMKEPVAPNLVSPPADTRRASLRVLGATAFGVGLVGLGIGAVTGVMAISRRDDAREACGNDDPKRCQNPSAVGQWGDALTVADVATVSLIAGGALASAGVVLWLLGEKSTTKVVAGADAHGGVFRLEGRW